MNRERITILVVEDSTMFRNLICRQLGAVGFTQVVQAKNGIEAIVEAEVSKPDMVLLDIVMPGLLGTEVLPQIREMLPTAVILMMSSLSESAVVQDCRDKGANGFVLKEGDDIAQKIVARIVASLPGNVSISGRAPVPAGVHLKPPTRTTRVITPFAMGQGPEDETKG